MSKKDERISEEAAVAIVRGFFRNRPEASTLTLAEVYAAANRPPEHAKANRVWLSNRLTQLRYHGLLTPIYTSGEGARKLAEIELTPRGREALARLAAQEDGQHSVSQLQSLTKATDQESGGAVVRQVAIDEVVLFVEDWAERHPAYKVNFTFSVEFVGKGR